MKQMDFEWWKKTVCYEIYPSSFQDSNGDGIGDIPGITSRLDYLASLGVGCIWVTPVYASPMKDNGYDVADFYKINPLYGTMEDMENLIAEADKRNIKIVMDLVFNHVSEESAWFQESKKSKDNPKSDWFIWRDKPNNWRGIFGGSAWKWCEERKQYYLHTFGDFQPDLNWENPEVRNALYDIANFWIQKGVGGFRMDAVVYIKKPADFADGKPDASDGMVLIHEMTANRDGILDYLHEFKKKVLDGKNVFTVGEANGIRPEELKHWVGSEGVFDMLFEFNHLQGGDIWYNPNLLSTLDLKKAIFQSEKATATNGWYPVFFENHDKPRSVNAYFPDSADKALASKALMTLLLTLRGTPFVYEGEEIGMSNVEWDSIDAYNELNSRSQYEMALQEGFSHEQAIGFVKALSRDNARTPMQWNSEFNAGFTTGKPWLPLNENFVQLNVATQEKDSNSPLAYFRKLVRLRKENPVLLQGTFTPILAEDPQIFAFRRSLDGKTVTVLVNLSEKDARYALSLLSGQKLLLSNEEAPTLGVLRPFEANLFE